MAVVDTFGAVGKIQSSTAVTYPAIWLMVKNGPDSAFKGALHLNVEQASTLKDELEAFINA